MAKPEIAQKALGFKLLNSSYTQMRSFVDLELQDSDPKDVNTMKSIKNGFRDRIQHILEKNKKLADFGKSNKGVQWLTRQTNKLMRRMKAILSEKSYNDLYSPDHFIPWTDKSALAVLVPPLSDDLGVCDESMDSICSEDTATSVTITGNGSNVFKHLSMYLDGDDSVLPIYTRTNFHGMDEWGKPLVNEAIEDLFKYINIESNNPDFEADRADLFSQLFGEITSCCSRLMKSAGEGPFRDFMIDDEYITKDHVKSQSALKERVVKDIISPVLIDLESQIRKSGPRSSGTQDEFWSQLSYSYIHAKNSIDQEFVSLLNDVAIEFADEFISTVGYVNPIPYVVGIDSSEEIGLIYDAIHGPDEEYAKEVYAVWQKILKNSLGSDCVYANIKKNTNKGAPYYTSKLTDIEWLNLIYNFYHRFECPESSSNLYPFIPGQRIQNSTIDGDNIKTRDRIIMQMAAMYISHQAWNVPLLRKMKDMPYFASYVSHENVGTVLDSIDLDSSNWLLSMDYSKYDSNCGPEMKEDHLWNLLGSIFMDPSMSIDDRKTKTQTDYTMKVADEWKHFYTRAPIIVPGGILFGDHGLFSGAPGTTIIGSLLNLIKTKAMIKYFNLKETFLFIQGDDTALSYSCNDKEITLSDISDFMTKLKHSVATDHVKQAFMKYDTNVSTYIMFVGKYYFLSNPENEFKLKVPVYSFVDMFSRFVFPEQSKMSIDEKTIKGWSKYDFNNIKYEWKNPKQNGETKLHPSLVMGVRITQSLINCINHPSHDAIVEHLVRKSPGLFKPIRDFGNIKDASVFDSEGTLLGMDLDTLLEGFGSQPTVKLILELLDNITHEYTEIVYMEDIEKAIKEVKILKGKSRNDNISDNDFKSQLGQAKKILGPILSTRAMNELIAIERKG